MITSAFLMRLCLYPSGVYLIHKLLVRRGVTSPDSLLIALATTFAIAILDACIFAYLHNRRRSKKVKG
jgi:hypothetical protein